MSEIVLQAALTILFGALAGGITNSLAIWMLFHPYEPPRVLGRRIRSLQGAIPKNKERLATAIGHAVGTRLLTPEDLARTVADPAFRAAFDERLSRFLTDVLEQRRGPIAETVSPAFANELRGLLDETAETLLARLDDYLESPEFQATARHWTEAITRELEDQPISGVLTADREAALADAAGRWIAETVGSEGFEHTIREYLDRTAERILEPGRTFQELLPTGLVATVEKAIASYLPIALERLGGLLEDPEARAQVQNVLREVLDRFMRDLKFHQRLVAALLITPETVDKVLRAVEAEGAGKLSELLHEHSVREAMARKVNDAVVDFLRRPIESVLGRPGDPNVEQAKDTISEWALSLARSPGTQAFLIDKLHATLRATEERTWGDVFRHLPPDAIADTFVAAARSERARRIYRETASGLIARALDRPIGRLADHLPADAAIRIQRSLSDPLWEWIQAEVPDVAKRVDVARQVERKILEFPMERVEELIRSVTERELQLIVRLGYILGGFIGVISATLGLLVR